MLEDHAQLGIVSKTLVDPSDTDLMAEVAFISQDQVKYQIVMRLAERWGIQAFQQNISPQEFCSRKFNEMEVFRSEAWTQVTKVILTAFVIREHAIYQQFFKDVQQ